MNGLSTLVRNWWMMAIRGGLAVAFGLAILGWPGVTLPMIVILFGVYAVADGVWAMAAAVRASTRAFGAWPVALEGLVGTVLGLVALVWPLRVSRGFVYVIVFWGLVTGVLEITAALRLPRAGSGHWLLATSGPSSLFLAVLVGMLPHADVESVAHVIGAYAVVFGIMTMLAALRFPRAARLARARAA